MFLNRVRKKSEEQSNDGPKQGETPSRRRSDHDAASPFSSAALEAERDLLRQVMQFMNRYELPVTSANLAIVCDGLSGSDTELRAAFTQREISKDVINQDWLDQLRPDKPDPEKRIDQMEDIMDLMENAMNEFNQTTQSARKATGAYSSAVSEHLDHPSTGEDTAGEEEFRKLLELSRVMLGQLKTIEAEMERNQQEADQLRKNLAKARQEADIDHLTGLPNRRAFERMMESETERLAELGEPLSIAFCDIDHFKAVNDEHGHDAGDRILKAVSKVLSETAHDACFVARHGGEEFVLLFSGLGKNDALEKLDATRLKLSRRRLMNRDTGRPFGIITFSAGVAQVDEYDNPREALSQADDALYRAKEAGRNQIISA